MKALFSALLLVSAARPYDRTTWGEEYGFYTGMHQILIVGVDPGLDECDHRMPSTYIRLLDFDKLIQLRGLWGVVGDTLTVPRNWIRSNCAWMTRCL